MRSLQAHHISDLDIFRTANTWIGLHGDSAVVKVREMSAQFRAKGDDEGADAWHGLSSRLRRGGGSRVGMAS